MFDLKYDPSIIEIPIPRYFKEDDRIEIQEQFEGQADLRIKSKIPRPKKKPDKKKKGEEEEKVEPIYLEEKKMTFDTAMAKHNLKGSTHPEVEVIHDDVVNPRITIIKAIEDIQRNERGRQGIARIKVLERKIKEELMRKDLEKKAREGTLKKDDEDEKENKACTYVQRRIRGILARKLVYQMRTEEMEFLGMTRKVTTYDDPLDDPLRRLQETQENRKRVRN